MLLPRDSAMDRHKSLPVGLSRRLSVLVGKYWMIPGHKSVAKHPNARGDALGKPPTLVRGDC